MQAATLAVDGVGASERRKPNAWWLELLEPYAGADLRRSLVCLTTSVLAYLALWPAMYYLLGVSYVLTLLVGVLASGFLVRSYIVFHDCSHGSFMASKRANTLVGIAVGLLVYSPFHSWRHEHAGHHATSGDLDRRGVGDVQTLTIAEYLARSPRGRLGYRLLRSPVVMFVLGPIWALAIHPRFIPLKKRRRIINSHLYTNLALAVLLTGACLLIGWQNFLLIQAPMILMAGAAGVWLFYVQHQFEGVYWQRSGKWTYLDAALQGSSYLKLPKPLMFFTGYIGIHHVHHLLPRIPNYNLQRAHDENPFLHEARTISLWEGLRAVRLKLYDEQAGQLVTFAQARARRGVSPAGAIGASLPAPAQPADLPTA